MNTTPDTHTRLDQIVALEPVEGGTEAVSGATLEMAHLADGSRVVLKRLPSEGDFLTRGTDGVGRARVLWESGVMARAATVVDHGVVDFVTDDEGRDVVVMRDLTNELLPRDARVSRDDVRGLLVGLAALHRLSVDDWLGLPLCTVASRYQLFAPSRFVNDTAPNPLHRGEWLVEGWEIFRSLVPGDIAAAVESVHRDASALEAALATCPQVLLHGDTKLENLGLGGGRIVAIDWGELTGIGAREVDVCWFVLMNAFRVDASPDQLLADYESAVGEPLDPAALAAAAMGSLAQMGFRLAHLAPELLPWWIGHARPAIDAGLAR